MNDVLWDRGEWNTHVFWFVHGRGKVEILEVARHELCSIFCVTNDTVQ